MTTKKRLVLIGNGMAGARFLEELLSRHGDDIFEITVFGEEPYGNYNRILLSGVLAGSHQASDIFLNRLDWYEQNKITLHTSCRVEHIDRQHKHVVTNDGKQTAYDTLVIATGSAPFIPDIQNLRDKEGNLRTGIFPFRTLDDCQNIQHYAGSARKAIVIGGGLLGLEAAYGMYQMGIETHVIHQSDALMNRQLDTLAATILTKALKEMGIQIHLQKRSYRALGEDEFTGMLFADGDLLRANLCIISAGIKPKIEVALNSGIQCERGILINDDLSCNWPDIYAIGECVQHREKVYGLVAPLWEQARCLAERLALPHSTRSYQGSQESTRLKVMGIDVVALGEKEQQNANDEVVVYSEPSRGIYKKLILRDQRLVGGILIGENQTTPRLLQLFDRKSKIPANRTELLFPLAPSSPIQGVEDLPGDAQICNCNGIAKQQIINAIKSGARNVKIICDATRAGTGCGACKPQLQALLEANSSNLDREDPSQHYYVPSIPFTKSELTHVIKSQNLRSVSSVFQALANGKEDPASKTGLASLLKIIWADAYEDERDARFINDRVHANIQRDGKFSVVPRIYGGVVTPTQLRKIADVAEKYEVPMVKITGGQRIDLLGIAKENLPAIWQELGMPSGHAYTKTFRTCKTCVGSEFCRYGVGDSTQLGINIEKRYQGIETPHKVKMAVSGCPRNCAESTIKDVGIVAIEGGKWEVYIGGAAGANVRKADLFCQVNSEQEALRTIDRFLQYYRENAKYMERTYDFVARTTISKLQQILLDDKEGLCAQLERNIQRSVDAYKDPWQEAITPATPSQFVKNLSIVNMLNA